MTSKIDNSLSQTAPMYRFYPLQSEDKNNFGNQKVSYTFVKPKGFIYL